MPRRQKPPEQEDEDSEEVPLIRSTSVDVRKKPEFLRVVKMKLQTFVPDKRITSRIETVVKDMDRLVAEAYVFSLFHIVRVVDVGGEIPSIDGNFYYRCIRAVGEFSRSLPGTLEGFRDSIEAFNRLRPPGQAKINGDRYNQVIADSRLVMATMAKNHLWLNLQNRIVAFARWKLPDVPRREHHTVATYVLFRPEDPVENASEATRALIAEMRVVMPLTNAQKFKDKHAHLTLPLYVRMLRESEHELERRQRLRDRGEVLKSLPKVKLWTLLPVKSGYTPGCFPISTMTLNNLLKDMGYGNKGQNEASKLLKRSIWETHCNLKLVETQNRTFADRIVTDGYGVSVLVNGTTPHVAALEGLEPRELPDDSIVVGVDPGFTDVVTIARSDGTIATFGGPEYYERAKYNHAKRRTQKWNAEAVPGQLSPKTADSETLSNFVSSWLASLESLLDHRRRRGYRKMRFLRHVHKQKTVQAIVDMIAPRDEKVTVGFGDWNGGHSSCVSRKTAGPLQEIRRELKMRPNVAIGKVDEFRTSKVCSGCEGLTKNMTCRKRGRTTRVHRVLHCRQCFTTWNRDVNASLNILDLTLKLLAGEPRPEAFRR